MIVPWHRSLFVRLFLIGALIAVVAVVAATWATVRSTTVAVRQEQAQSLHDDATTYDALIEYAATHPSWSGAEPLVTRLAASTGHRVTVTDETGRVLASSSPGPALSPSAARATLDPLRVDSVLLSTVTTPAPTPSAAQSAVPVPATCADCRRLVVPASSTIDSRAAGPFADDASPAWATLQQHVDRCLGRAGLDPVLALRTDFGVIVGYPQGHARVARCVDASRRDLLAPYVAPPALLFVSGPSTAALTYDLSGSSTLRIALLAGLVLLVTLALSALLAGYVVRPLRTMAGAAQRAGEGDLSARVSSRRTDELGEVARAFNQMASRRQQLEESRRRLVSDVSHELRTPLANLRGWVEAAQDGLAPLDARLLDSLHEEALHLQSLTDDLHDLALGDAGELRLAPVPVVLGDLLEQVADSFGSPQVSVRADPTAYVVADPVRLRQAVVNLVANALRHTPPPGTVTLSGAPGVITVSDTGEGIAPEELPHVFDRFRRADPSRTRGTGGTGLGLAIVRAIVEAHGGTAAIDSAPGRGTVVTLSLPDAATSDIRDTERGRPLS